MPLELPPAEQTLVSIGMPAYNSSRLIRRALDSVLAQDHQRFELIICDDASTDNTTTICREYAERDGRIRLINNPANLGPLVNFQRVLQSAVGEYFMWAAHDDYREPNYISALLRRLKAEPACGMCVARYVKVTVDGTAISSHPFPAEPVANRVGRLRGQMRSSGAPWVYGLYRTERIRPVYERVSRTGLVWFWDHLVELNFLLNSALTGTNDTTIYQVKTGLSAGLFRPKTKLAAAGFAARIYAQAFSILLTARLRPAERLQLMPELARYIEMQALHWRLSRPGRSINSKRRRWSMALRKPRS